MPKSRTGTGLILSGLLLCLAGCSPADLAQAQNRQQAYLNPAGEGGVGALDTTTAARLSGAFRAAAERALPAVVFVEVTGRAPATMRQMPWPFPWPDLPQPQVPESPQVRGGGSGFVFDRRGYLITNHHVIQHADQVDVLLFDGRRYAAEVVGSDRDTDVAVLKITLRSGEQLSEAVLGDSEALRVGDWVLALGNPLNLGFTVTAGIVSAKGRSLGIIGGDEEARARALEAFIQTDAAINRGNSGGPLVDLLGRVVGVNTAIASQTGFSEGYGFAIPIDLAVRVANDLIEHGVVRRPRLGIEVRDVDHVIAERFGLDAVAGAFVPTVQSGTPAADAGMQMGDVIVSLDGEPIRTSTDLRAKLAQRQPGDVVRLGVVRENRRIQLQVRLGQFDLPAEPTARPAQVPAAEEILGFQVQPLRQADLERFGVDSGVLVRSVVRNSPASRNGLQGGEVLRRLNEQDISRPEDVERIARGVERGQIVTLVLRRPGDNDDTMIIYQTR